MAHHIRTAACCLRGSPLGRVGALPPAITARQRSRTPPARARVLERGEKIELLVDKAENLNQQAFKFRKQSTALKRAMWLKNLKLYALVAFMLGVRHSADVPRL